ncbi:hypothetical protein BGZ58_010629 [Dissophora ornata]|nr:hypothetical protein BGZ58_010629 [Dissophora ornata]
MDPDDVDAQQWQNSSAIIVEPEDSPLPLECDDYWFIPTYTETNVLEDQLETFSHSTATHMTYNREQEQAELKKKAKKTKGWAKPDRELTAAEEKKKKRKDLELMESRRYLGTPPGQCLFEHRLRCPSNFPVLRLLGGNLHVLDDLRTECKSFIWIEQPSMTFCIAGDGEHSTFTAVNRIKNFILKRTRAPIDTVCHVLEKPSKLVKIHMTKTPPVPYIASPPQIASSQSSTMINQAVFIRAKEVETFANLLTLDLKMATTEEADTSRVQSTSDRAQEAQNDTTGARDDEYVSSLKYMDGMTDRNVDRIREALEETLNQVQLQDGDIKMRIRVKNLDKNMIPDKRLKSDFSPFITRSSEKFVSLARKLTPPDNKDLLTQPEVLWSLGILKRVEATNAHIIIQLDVTFRDDEKVSLWNALVQKMTPLDLKVVSSERPFSWAWTITTGKRLEADKFSPEGKFVYELRLEKREGQDDRLVFSNTPVVQLKHIRRERKRLFIHDPWTIELIEEAFWTLSFAHKPYQSVALPAEPDHILYSVSMYRDSWTTRFCENPHLSLGAVPTWDPADFFTGEESIVRTMEAVNYLRDMVEDVF